MVHGGSTIPNHTRAWWPPLLSSTSITHLPEASPRSFAPTTRYLAEENTVIQEIWKSIWNLNLRPKRISGLVDIPLPRLPISPHPNPLVNVGTERRIPSLPPHDVFFPGWRMHIKASIRTRCYADLNLRRSSCAVYHRNLLPYWVSRAVARMWDVWRSRIPQSQFKEAPISSPNIGSSPVVYLLALISWGRYLCVYASHTTDIISFHFIRLSYQTIVLSYFIQSVSKFVIFFIQITWSISQEINKSFLQ